MCSADQKTNCKHGFNRYFTQGKGFLKLIKVIQHISNGLPEANNNNLISPDPLQPNTTHVLSSKELISADGVNVHIVFMRRIKGKDHLRNGFIYHNFLEELKQ